MRLDCNIQETAPILARFLLRGECMMFITALLNNVNQCYIYHICNTYFIIKILEDKSGKETKQECEMIGPSPLLLNFRQL